MRYFGGLFVALLLPAALHAQEPQPDTSLIRVLQEAARESAFLRIAAASMHEARINGVVDGEVRLVGARVPVVEITRVERRVRTGGGSMEGALIGSAVGALGAVFFLGGAGGADRITDYIPLAGIGAVIGGLLGFFLGGSADPPAEEWTVLWVR